MAGPEAGQLLSTTNVSTDRGATNATSSPGRHDPRVLQVPRQFASEREGAKAACVPRPLAMSEPAASGSIVRRRTIL
jgi:hypothetical protein